MLKVNKFLVLPVLRKKRDPSVAPVSVATEVKIDPPICCRTEEGLSLAQEDKYTVQGGKIVNRATGKPIPDDEPIFIFRASDNTAISALHDAAASVSQLPQNEETVTHWLAIGKRIQDFMAFAQQHPERMKTPTTAK